MNIEELKPLFAEINKLKSKAKMNRTHFCSELTNSDNDEYLEFHFSLLEQKKRYFQADLKMFFGFRKDRLKTHIFLKNKLATISDETLKSDIIEILEDINYKTLDEYKEWLDDIKSGKKKDEHQFVWSIMKSPFVEYHYELMKDIELSEDFRKSLQIRFDEHKEKGETLLLSKLDNNEDIDFQGEIIFILGKIKGKGKDRILTHTRELTKSANKYTRNRAIIVLGWIGKSKDFGILEKHLLEDNDIECRSWSATAFYIIYDRIKSKAFKIKVFRLFKEVLEKEKEYFVIGMIIYSMQQITKNKFGISEKAIDDLDKNRIDLTKEKVKRFIEKEIKNVC